MSADELAAFLDDGPTGAICLTDAAGRLLALPADVIGGQESMLNVEIDGFDGPPSPGTPACVVADRFPSYEAIRGVIAQGSIASAVPATPGPSIVTVAVARTVTFSFANVSM
ncbi:MAG: hypothetical protein QOJ24_582 [Mycobacterium sp.]|jgi:hypothetical protein|nr:hypothetical protein [Mycobacterium sp.]